MGLTLLLLFFFKALSFWWLFCRNNVIWTYSLQAFHAPKAWAISQISCMKSAEMEFFLFLMLRCILCCLCVLRRLSGNNGFLFIPLAHGWGLSQALCCLPYYFLLSLCWVWRRGENFSMTGISTPSSSTPLSLLSQYSHSFLPSFSLSLSLCQLHHTVPSCLHIAWSKTTSWSLTACSPCAFSSLPSAFFLLSLVAPATPLRARTKEKCRTQRKWNVTLKIVLLAGNDIVTVTKCCGG